MSPHAHLHAQAICGPIDTSAPGSTFWRRNVVFAGVNWYSIDDLRAEIRYVLHRCPLSSIVWDIVKGAD
jgi:hypothetical protein